MVDNTKVKETHSLERSCHGLEESYGVMLALVKKAIVLCSLRENIRRMVSYKASFERNLEPSDQNARGEPLSRSGNVAILRRELLSAYGKIPCL